MHAVPALPGPTPGAYLRMIAVAAIWASTYSVGRHATAHVAPHAMALMRFVVAAAALMLFAWRREGGLRVPRGQWPLLIALAATSVLAYNLCFFSSVKLIPASRLALIVALNPIVVALAGALVLRTRLRPGAWAGVLLGLAGVLLVVARGDPAALGGSLGPGEALAFGCTLAWSSFTLLARRIPGAGLTSLSASAWTALIGAAMLVLPAVAEGDLVRLGSYPADAWLAATYLGVVASAIAFVWYADGVRVLGATRAIVFTNLVPLIAVAIGVLLLGERLHWSMPVGGALAVLGVTLVSRAGAVPGATEARPASLRASTTR